MNVEGGYQTVAIHTAARQQCMTRKQTKPSLCLGRRTINAVVPWSARCGMPSRWRQRLGLYPPHRGGMADAHSVSPFFVSECGGGAAVRMRYALLREAGANSLCGHSVILALAR